MKDMGKEMQMNRMWYGSRRRPDNKGMMTLEAVVILPLSLMVTFLLLWIGMLLYDRAAVSYAVSAAVIRGSRMAEASNEEILACVQEKIPELLEGRLVMMHPPQMDVRVEYGLITASVQGYIDAPVLAGFGGNWEVYAERSADRMRSSQIVRTIKRVDRMAARRGSGAAPQGAAEEEEGGNGE